MKDRDRIVQAIAACEAELLHLNQKRQQVTARLDYLRADCAVLEDLAGDDVCFNKFSPVEEKIRLFADLFRGRQDVFARFWCSQKSGKKGYSPVCEYEWQQGICTKPERKCIACKYTPLTDEILRAHLEGKHVVGVYPLLKDETCCFLAVDFDGEEWQRNCGAFLATCQNLNIPAALERSRSGNGGHVWIFFADPVPAARARNLGSYILTETISRHHQLGMESYDRLFPNQDTMPKGGFGNLIALPLQKEARRQHNTEFLNEQFQPYADQWAFLSSIPKMSFEEIQRLGSNAVIQNRIHGLALESAEQKNFPWKPAGKSHLERIHAQLPAQMKVTIANQLYIATENLPSVLLAEIRWLASFPNPKFYEAQKMRRSTFRIPRIISCVEDYSEHVAIPRGCGEALHTLSRSLNLPIETGDERFTGSEIEIGFYGDLNENQKKAIENLGQHDMGMLVAPPGYGKTAVSICLLAQRKVPTLILVHRKPLLTQWRNQLTKFLHLDPQEIGQVGGGRDSRTGRIDVAMLQSVVRKGKVDSIVSKYGHVIIDECHHIPAFSFELVLKQVRARYVTGLTATPFRRDGHHPIISMYCGPIRFQSEYKTQAETRSFQQRLIVRHTELVLPEVTETSFTEILQILAEDDRRNELIVTDALKALQEKRELLLLTERRRHLELLRGRFERSVEHLFVLHGGLHEKDRILVQQKLAEVPQDEVRLILATGSYIGEGFDDPRLDTLFLAMPVSFKGKLLQYVGRILRLHPGKKEAYVYDYVDSQVPMLARMFKKRLAIYRAMGFEGEEIARMKKHPLAKADSLELPLQATG